MSLSDFHSVVNEFLNDQQWHSEVTLIKTTSVYVPETSENIVTEKRYTMQAIPLDYINKNEGVSTNAQTLIRSGDKQVFIKPSKYVTDIDPSADMLQMGSKVYKIITVKEMNTTLSDVLYYELFVRI